MSKDVIELNIVDLVSGLGLESLQDDGLLLLGNLHAEVVEDGTESSESDEARSASVLILEVRLDQKTSVLDISTEASKAGHEDLLFVSVDDILGVKNGWGIEGGGTSGGVLLQSFISEDGI